MTGEYGRIIKAEGAQYAWKILEYEIQFIDSFMESV